MLTLINRINSRRLGLGNQPHGRVRTFRGTSALARTTAPERKLARVPRPVLCPVAPDGRDGNQELGGDRRGVVEPLLAEGVHEVVAQGRDVLPHGLVGVVARLPAGAQGVPGRVG